MTKEDKQLLLVDLSARLPYGVKFNYGDYNGCDYKVELITSTIVNDFPIEDCKPYLRSMSSMAEEEQKEFVQFHCVNLCPIIMNDCLTINNESKMFDWLNAHHFDFRNLIERGLAIDCTGLNIY